MSLLDRQPGQVEAWSGFHPKPAQARDSSAVLAARAHPHEWLEDARVRIEGLRSLEPNWDSYGAMPVHTASIRHTLNLVNELAMIQNVPAPAVTASNDGHAALCWDSGTWSLDLEVLPDGGIDYVYLDRRDRSRDQEGRNTDPGIVAGLLAQW